MGQFDIGGPDSTEQVASSAGLSVILGSRGARVEQELASRAIDFIRDGRTGAERLLLLSPSGRAARNVSARIRDSLTDARPTSASFAGLAINVLSDHFRAAGFRRAPRVLTSLQQRDSLRVALAREDASRWPTFKSALSSVILLDFANDVLEGAAQNQLPTVELRRRSAVWHYPGLSELADFIDRYRADQSRESIIDYGHAIELAARLLESSAAISGQYRSRFAAIFVAEFEDASAAEIRLLTALANEDVHLVVAGDPRRAIASYRGGSADHLLTLAARPRASVTEIDGRTLEVDAVGKVIGAAWQASSNTSVPSRGISSDEMAQREVAAARHDSSSESRPADRTGTGPATKATITEFATTSSEASHVVDEISRLVRSGTPLSEIAIVSRTLGSEVPGLIVAELRRRGVPVDVADGRRALDEPLVQSLVYLLRSLLDPTPEIALRLLDSPLAELPRFGLPRLRAAASRAGVPLESMLETGPDELDVAPEIVSALVRLRTRVASLRARPGGPSRAAASAVFDAWSRFGVFRRDALGAGRGAAAVRSLLDELDQRRRVLGRDVTIAEFITLIDTGSLARLTVTSPRRPGVAICTVHAAKGREWQVVFLPDMVEGVFPLRRSRSTLAPLLDSNLPASPTDGCDSADSVSADLVRLRRQRQDEEERRIFYVAVSCARSALHFTYSRRGRDGKAAQSRSRYLESLNLETTVQEGFTDDLARILDVRQAVALLRRQIHGSSHLDRARGALGLRMIAQARPDLVRPNSWWSMISQTSGAGPTHATGRLNLSASRLGTYRDCPLAYQYGYEWRIGEVEGAALTTGSTLHAILEEYHRPGSSLVRSEEALIESLDRVFKPADYPYKPVARQERIKLGRLLHAHFRRYGQDPEALAVERAFSFKLGAHDIRGFIDRIDRLPDQTLELIDYKSGNPMTKEEAEGDLQLALYDLAFHLDPGLASLGVPSIVTYLYPKDLIDAGPRKTGKRSYTPTPESRDGLVAWTEATAGRILSEIFPAYLDIVAGKVAWDVDELDRLQRKDPCAYCAFTWICPAIERGGGETE